MNKQMILTLVLTLMMLPGQTLALATPPGKSLVQVGQAIVPASRKGAGAAASAPADWASVASTTQPATPCGSIGADCYVDGTNGNDEWDGTTPATAWRTIHKANQTLQPGDTVYIRGGTYYVGDPMGYPTASTEKQGINPKNSGTEGNPITYTNYDGEEVNFVGDGDRCIGIDLNSDYGTIRSYIIVKGLNFHNLYKYLWILRGGHNEIAYCDFQGPPYQRSDNLMSYRGSTIYRHSQYNHVHHCTFGKFGRFNNGSSDINEGILFELGNAEGADDDFTSYNLIEDNHFYHGGHHVMGVHGSYNVVRNNYFHNEKWWEDDHGDLWGYRVVMLNGDPTCNKRNLFEGNRVAFGGDCKMTDQSGGGGVKISSPYHIVRNNLIYSNDLNGIFLMRYWDNNGMVNSNHVYNNVFYHNGHTTVSKPSSGPYLTHAVAFAGDNDSIQAYYSGNCFKNNIFYDNDNEYNENEPIVKSYYLEPHYPVPYQTIGDNWNEAGAGDALFVYDGSPLDPFGDKPDFHLRPGSPCIDTGGFLTSIASPDGSGTQFQVEDAGYFMDGWGIVEGDVIQLEGSTVRAQITHVDYDANTIIVDRSISWRQGIGAALAYQGAAPDIGAYEFEPELELHGAPGDKAIYLDWTVNITLPVTATWHIDYYTQTVTAPFTATDPLSATRAYTLTGLTNYQWYTVTLTAVGTSLALSDTVRVMPTDRFVYLPLVLRAY